MINAVTAICLVLMLAIIATTIIKLFTLDRAGKYEYIKNFKRGKFALIYLVAVPLYWIGIVYGGVSVGKAFLSAIKISVDLVLLKCDYVSVAALISANVFYHVTVDICYLLVIINAILFVFALIGQKVYNYFKLQYVTKISKTVYVVVGNNGKNLQIIQSVNKSGGNAILVGDGNDKIAEVAFAYKAAYLKLGKNGDVGKLLYSRIKSFEGKSVNVIVNTTDDALNLVYTEQIRDLIKKVPQKSNVIDDISGIKAYVFGEPENASAFEYFVADTKGSIHYLNKYRLSAMDFVEKFPITEFMDGCHVDYDTATIKENVDINVAMIGFGRANRQLFLTSVAANQFLTLSDGKLTEKAVDYWIYDKKEARNDKNLNHNYYRFQNELDSNTDNYLSLPKKPANEKFFELDINDPAFYNSIRKNLSCFAPTTAYNYIIISFGTDMENLDFAEKITAKLKEWNLFDSTKVFARIRDNALSEEVAKKYSEDVGFFCFGNEKEVVYNVKRIVSETKEVMARDKHLSYALRDAKEDEKEEALKAAALVEWNEKSQIQRESNAYACLTIRMKLQLMGYDYCALSENFADASNDFLERYQKGDPIDYFYQSKEIKGKRLIRYSNNMVEGSLRHTMAILEHQRWNAYMICCGMIPSTRDQIKNGNNKDFTQRRHGNITTFDGLKEFRTIEAERRKKTEEETDVIRYDYQIMDDLVWLLHNVGYKVIKKTPHSAKQ